MPREEKEVYVNQVFDSIAKDYDRMNNLMTWGMLPAWQRLVMSKTGLRPGDCAIDVCCGTGEMAYQLKEIVGPKGCVVGLDFSAEMLRIARHKQAELGPSSVDFVQGDALAMPFDDDTFGAATNGFALRNVRDIKATFAEMRRVIRPGGMVVCIDVSRPANPLFAAFFDLYYYRFVPFLGHLVDRNRKIAGVYPAYTWLAESLRTFPPPEALQQLMLDVGLQDVGYRRVGFGAATIIWGRK